MTKISTITSALETLITDTLTGIKKIPNPYEPEINPAYALKFGYGIGFGAGANARREMHSSIDIDRQIEVLIFKEIAKADTDGAGIQTEALSLLENEISLIKAVEAETSLGTAHLVRYLASDPLEYLIGDQRRYFRLLTVFGFEYNESY
jgi:hypothetical protein